jgi:hypothetical protein
MDDILSRIASFARNVPAVQTVSSAAKCPTPTDLIEAIVSPRISPDRLKERVSVHNTKAALLCFSKDRPYQLEQFLISAKLFLSPDKSALKIFVLYSPGRLSTLPSFHLIDYMTSPTTVLLSVLMLLQFAIASAA